jgi:RNA polymerase sigma-70 factor (ECF subfamily)
MKHVKLPGTGHGVNAITTSAWHQHSTFVQGYLCRRLHDPMLAEDLTQETFLRLHRAQPELQKPAQLRAWLLRTAHNLLIDHVRARKPEVPLDESLPLVGNETATWRAFEPCIVPLAQRLPEDYRSALLWDLDGVPQQEIAERQGLGLSGAKSRVQRARGLLAAEFSRCCDDLSDSDSALFGCATASAVVERA